MTRRFQFLILTAALACGGCTPRDPLEWKISAGSPNELNEWLDDTTDRLPDDLKGELGQALHLLRGDANMGVAPRTMYDTHNPFCMRVNRRTIREVILDGYQVEKVFLLQRLSRESEYMTANLGVVERSGADPEKIERAEAVKSYQEKTVDVIKKRLAEIETRVTALSAQSSISETETGSRRPTRVFD